MTEHTHGPWEIREIAHEATPFNERRVYRVEIGSPIVDRASKHRYGTRPVCQITDFGRIGDPANASLIAAAPDLLAALELAKDELDRMSVMGGYGPCAFAYDTIDAAIARAKGGHQ